MGCTLSFGFGEAEVSNANWVLCSLPQHVTASWKLCAHAACPVLLCRLLRSLDYFCLTKSIIFSVIIIRAFSSNWAWYQTAQAVLYLAVSVVQLLTMHLKGELYHRYRFQVGVEEPL